MDVQRILEGRRKVRFTYNVDEKLLDKVKILAIERHQRTNELIDDILIDFIKQIENQKENNQENVIPSKMLYM